VRRKTITIDKQSMENFLHGRMRQGVSNAPKDMKVSDVILAPGGPATHWKLILICESEKWPDVKQGEDTPEFDLIFTMPGNR
jgi:hypothetical protein